MGLPIIDGTGKGYSAKVNEYNQQEVSAVQKSELAFISEETGEAFSWTTVTSDLAAADTGLLIANTHTTKKLHICDWRVYSDVPTAIQIHCPAYPTLAGTVVTGQCLNRSRDLDVANYALAYSDETGNTQGDIIETVHTNEVATDVNELKGDFGGSLILGPRQCIAWDIVEDSAAFQIAAKGYYK